LVADNFKKHGVQVELIMKNTKLHTVFITENRTGRQFFMTHLVLVTSSIMSGNATSVISSTTSTLAKESFCNKNEHHHHATISPKL